MNEQDRQAIDGLFVKLAEAESRTGPRDGEAEGFIAQCIARQPAAPYLMAQTIVMQDYALQQAQARIEELERQAAQSRAAEDEAPRPASGGLLGGLFGSSAPPARRGSVPSMPRAASGASGAWGQTGGAFNVPPPGAAGPGTPAPGAAPRPGFGGAGGGGFLAGAAQTAMGVAGGVLLGNAIAGMFRGSEAQAAESSPASAADAPAEETDAASDPATDAGYDDISASDEGGWFDGGGWFGDGEL
ncbi:DUF2076 domain-containing protein [Ancylobacter pratisalsi]|uniref:DUF2076 domain-containing protein n=1 Tax=Ancylobacter pratisalsi TaxID=1745854 RepID=A0A6P1YNI8_9HYPH|nr:DUF2076 domain-containing protein [Ancylobacter pratisalsi]QIB33783.1 DUF2076 domain-containing protein [Ancylobacter pratisalsi]